MQNIISGAQFYVNNSNMLKDWVSNISIPIQMYTFPRQENKAKLVSYLPVVR